MTSDKMTDKYNTANRGRGPHVQPIRLA